MTISTLLAIASLLILMYLGYGIITKETKRPPAIGGADDDNILDALSEKSTFIDDELTEEDQEQEEEKKTENPPVAPIRAAKNTPPFATTKQADPPISFGANRLWMAIRTTDQQQIAQLLELENLHPATWYEGLEERSPAEGGIFVTPPIDGWILVTGWGFMADTLTETVEIGKKLITQFSTKFGEAQYFCTHTRADYHCWMLSLDGSIERAYAWLGEEGENLIAEGDPTAAEPKHLVNTLSAEAQEDNYFAQEDLIYPNLDLVLYIASKWSLNPATLNKRTDIRGMGLFGD